MGGRMSRIILSFGILALVAFVLSNWQTQAHMVGEQSVELAAAEQAATSIPPAVKPTSTLAQTSDPRKHCPVTSPVAIADSEIPRDSWSDPIHSPGWYKSG